MSSNDLNFTRKPIPSYHRNSMMSNQSMTSSQSNINNYPVGLIKVYQSDEESMDSFSITSRKKSDVKSIISLVEPVFEHQKSTASFSDSNDLSYETAATSDDTSLFDLWFRTPDTERENAFIPLDGIERPKYVLEKIVQSFRADKGAFLTRDIFLNNRIYQQSETILNGSVKINIIQEINSLLKKFKGDNLDLTTFNSLEQTLGYYKKLMDAFDVLQLETAQTLNDSTNASISSQSSNTSPQAYKTISRESTISAKKSNSNLSDDKPKKRNSLFLDKFKGKMKNSNKKRMSLNYDTHYSPTPSDQFNTHSRSVSVSSTASSRSAKDQATIYEYLETIENLQITLSTIYDQQLTKRSAIYQEKLNSVIQFLSQYIIKFLLTDITALSLKYMKKSVKDLL